MNMETDLQRLLRWRLSLAEGEGPAPPSASRLIAMSRPWWEAWPEQFQGLVERLFRMQTTFGYAMADPSARSGHPVPTLMVQTETKEETETSARILYFDIRNGGLRLRFQLDRVLEAPSHAFEATFVSSTTGRPLFSALATLSANQEYRIDAQLAEDTAQGWESLKVTDGMPFRLILRTRESSQ